MEINPLLFQGITLAIMTLVVCGGMQSNWRAVIATMRKPVWLLRAILAVNVAVPLAEVIICLLLPLDPTVQIGIMIMAASPIAPPLSLQLVRSAADAPKDTGRPAVDASTVTGHFALITMLSVITVPVTLALTSRLMGVELDVPVAGVAKIAALLLLAPIAVGVTIGTLFPAFAMRAARPMALAGYAVLFALAAPLFYMQAGKMVGLVGDGTILAMVLISLAAVAAGHLLGGPRPLGRLMLATAAVVRHPGISLWVVASNYLDPQATTAVLLFLVINLIVSAAYQHWAKARFTKAAAALST